MIEAALAGGHEVTLFNRGQTNPEEFPQVERLPGDRSSSVRAGLIVGPHDPTGRFAYWPHRIARGGEVLVPGPPERQVQFVDVRDLADLRPTSRWRSPQDSGSGPWPRPSGARSPTR